MAGSERIREFTLICANQSHWAEHSRRLAQISGKNEYMIARTYQGLQDLHAMLDLLAQGREADNGTYYVHRGDLQWWLFYTDVPAETWQSNIAYG
jgi:hypothetical protein